MSHQSDHSQTRLPQSNVSRRSWLATSAGVGIAALSTSRSGWVDAAPLADETSTSGLDQAIDAHVHVWTPDTSAYPLDSRYDISAMQPPSFTPEQLRQQTDPANVSRVVLIQMSFYGVDNSYMLDVIADQPQRFRGVAVIDPEDRPEQTMKSLRPKGVRGFRIVAGKQDPQRWLAGEGMQAMWRCAADQSMSICPLMNPEYIPSIDQMCQRYPETTVVVDHFARIGIDGQIRKRDVDALCRLARHKNVYVKTSAFYALGKKQAPYTDLGGMIHDLTHAFGTDRLMWASDCPYQVQSPHTYHESIELVRSKLDFLSLRDRQWMLRGTAEKVFFNQ